MREYFGERLREASPEAWRAGHERLYEHYRTSVDDLPDTLEGLMPLYAAVVHGCRAGRVQEACDEVYFRRILRGDDEFSWRKLGAFGAELTALAAFFDPAWNQPSDQLTAPDQAWVLAYAGFHLRGLGRLPEAVQPMRAGLEARIAEKNWKEAAPNAGNLSELTLTLGEVASAVAAGEESVELADRSEDAFQRMSKRATLADALHQAGRWEESASSFREAEAMQAEMQPHYPRLYSVQGYRYCDLLLGRAEPEDGSGWEGVGAPLREACKEVRERATEIVEIGRRDNVILEVALGHFSLARAHLGLALTSAAPDWDPTAEHMDRAVDGLRQAGQEDDLPRGLLARAALHRLTPDPAAAARDLAEALEIAERGSMRLHEADAHLELTRLTSIATIPQPPAVTSCAPVSSSARRAIVVESGRWRTWRKPSNDSTGNGRRRPNPLLPCVAKSRPRPATPSLGVGKSRPRPATAFFSSGQVVHGRLRLFQRWTKLFTAVYDFFSAGQSCSRSSTTFSALDKVVHGRLRLPWRRKKSSRTVGGSVQRVRGCNGPWTLGAGADTELRHRQGRISGSGADATASAIAPAEPRARSAGTAPSPPPPRPAPPASPPGRPCAAPASAPSP